MIRGVILLLTALASLAGEVGAQGFEPSACPFRVPPGQLEGQTVECGFLSVPENRTSPNGRSIRLAVAIFRDQSGTTQPDPIVYLNGGPGGSALMFIYLSFPSFYGPVLGSAHRDLIVFDQRGVVLSQPDLNCTLTTGTLDDFMACQATLQGVADLTAYNTVENAADVEDLRLALGYGQVNLWGTSYGTRLALGVMRDFPQGLRSVVLDSVYPPQVDLYLEGPANADRAFEALFQACAQDPECSVDYPNLRGVFYGLVDRLRTAPTTITLRDPFSGQTFPYTVDDAGMEGILFNFLYSSELLPYLPRLIFDADQNRWSSIGNLLGSMFAQASRSVSRGMQLSVLCNEEAVFGSAGQFEAALAEYPQLEPLYRGSILGGFGYQVCEGWDSGQAGPAENQAVASAVPTFIMSGAFDPITPPHWAEQTQQTLSAASRTLYPATGHGASATACGQSMLVAFLEDPSQPPSTECVSWMSLRFVGPNDALPFSEDAVRAMSLPSPLR